MISKDCVLVDKKSTFIDKRAKIGKNVIIYENCRIDGECEIGDNVTIFPNCFIDSSIIGKGSKIYSSILENCKLGSCASVGPFCHLRNANVENFVHIGDFSVVKHSLIKKNKVLEPFSCILDNKEFKK